MTGSEHYCIQPRATPVRLSLLFYNLAPLLMPIGSPLSLWGDTMAKRKKQAGIIANAERFVRDALGVPANEKVYTVSCTYCASLFQWDLLVTVGNDAIAVIYYPPIVKDGILGGDVWAM